MRLPGEAWAALISGGGVALAGAVAWLRYRRKDSAETRKLEAETKKTSAEADSIAVASTREAIAAWREALQRLRALEAASEEHDRKLAAQALALAKCEEDRFQQGLELMDLRERVADVERVRE
jgi:hypothetical protein